MSRNELFDDSFGQWLGANGVELLDLSRSGIWSGQIDLNKLKAGIMSLENDKCIAAYDKGYDDGERAKPPKLVDAVEFRREQYSWNKTKMAAMLDLSLTHYSEFLHGKRGLPVHSIRKAYAIGIPASVLLQDDIDRQLEGMKDA